MSLTMSEEEIRHILFAADDLISSGGRTMLAKILKGSRDKKLLELELQHNIAYGYYSSLTLLQITERIDKMIKHDYIQLEQAWKMQVIAFTTKGWIIQRDQYTDLLLSQWQEWITSNQINQDMTYLKDRNRGLILLFLHKVAATSDPSYIPLLQRWKQVDYQKVSKALDLVIIHLQKKEASSFLLVDAPTDMITPDLFTL